MKNWFKKGSIFLFLAMIMVLFTGVNVKAAAITPGQVIGTWDGEYDGDWYDGYGRTVDVKRHVTFIFTSCDSSGYFKGGLYLAAIPGKDYQFTGSYNISGTINLSTGAMTMNPGSWIKQISSFNKSNFRGTFQISSKKLTGYRYIGYSNRNSTRYKFNVTKISNNATANKLTYISLSTTSTTLTEGKSTSLSFTVSPNTITPSSVKWTSSNTKVATVSSAGKITAVGAGTATITCTATYNGSSVSAKCTVKVNADPNAIHRLTITVKDKSTGRAVSGATAAIRSGKNVKTGSVLSSVTTDSNGTASFSVKKGTYTLAISRSGYNAYYANYTISANKSATANMTPVAVCRFTITAKNTSTGAVLVGATVDARSGKNNQTGTIVASTKTDSNGVATLNLKKGDYTICISKKDFKTYYANYSVSSSKTTTANVTPVKTNQFTVSGTVKDAATGKAVSNAQVDARSGKNNRTGTIVASTKTDNNGAYALNLPKGDYTLQITKKNFVGYFVNVALTGNKTVSTPITQTLADSKFRIVLSWGSAPKDLDLHVTGPTNGSTRFHTYWSKRKYTLNGFVLSLLDVDSKKGYGPETNTLDLSKGKNGIYHIYVHDYTDRSSGNTNALAKSGAKVDIYSGSKLLATYPVPNVYGTVWQVCDIVNGTLRPINTVNYDKNLLTK